MDLRRILIAGVTLAALAPAAASFAKGGADDAAKGANGGTTSSTQVEQGHHQRRNGRATTTAAGTTVVTVPGTPGATVTTVAAVPGAGSGPTSVAARTKVEATCDLTAPCPAGAAGTVTLTRDPATSALTVTATTPAAGWTATVERAAGPEPEVSFTNGTGRVTFSAEVEGGVVRTEVETR